MRARSKPATAVLTHETPDALLIGALLLFLLIFATASVFVRSAWALQAFQIGIYAVVAGYLLVGIRRKNETVSSNPLTWPIYLIPVWGVVQILTHTTSSTFTTRAEVLRWGSLVGVFFLAQVVARSSAARRWFLTIMLCFATGMAALCLLQLFTSDGRVLWLFPTGYPDVFATFPNHSNYSQFAELALPIVLWRALREGKHSWWYALAGGIIYASVIGSASRAGAILCTLEVLAMLLIWLATRRKSSHGKALDRRMRSALAVVGLIPLFAILFTFAVGWQKVVNRFDTTEPFTGRWEFLVAATRMAQERPLTGFGLGTFPEVYQKYAVKDFPFYANHAHNDWAEFAADGGIPFLLLFLVPFAAIIPTAIRHSWGIGLVAVMLHACVDFPFPRPAVSGWMFALLAILYIRRESGSAPPQTPPIERAAARPISS